MVPMFSFGRRRHRAAFAFAGLVILVVCGAESALSEDDSSDSGLDRAAARLQPPLVVEGREQQHWPIEERMRKFSVPGVSAAVIEDGRLAAARAWGVKVVGEDDPVTTETMLQAGSLSKPVTALLALGLVGEGALELDRPVNAALRSWKVPDNDLTRTTPVTLQHVLSHQAGLTPFGYLIPRSEAAVPSMADLLRGGIHDWPAITVESPPGERYAYSNAGYCVLQLVLEDVSSLSLHELAVQRMFGPLNMNHSTFDEPLAAETLATVAAGHRRTRGGEGSKPTAVPVEGKAEIAPAAAGGLWSTPSDLARVAVEVMRAWRGESSSVVRPELARTFLTRQVGDEGLGIHLQGEGPTLRARHGGAMPGFVASLVFYPNRGQGAVVMSNSDGGRWLHQELVTAIALEYGWPDLPVVHRLGSVTPEQLRGLVGVYRLDGSPSNTFTVELVNGKATGQVNQYPPFVLTPTTEPDLFVLPRESLEIRFERDEEDAGSKVLVGRPGDSRSSYSRRQDP